MVSAHTFPNTMVVSCSEFVVEAHDCVFGLARPSLIEIIDIEPTRSKIVFWEMFGGFRLLMYLVSTVIPKRTLYLQFLMPARLEYLPRTHSFLLAVVEDESDVVKRDKANAGDDGLP